MILPMLCCVGASFRKPLILWPLRVLPSTVVPPGPSLSWLVSLGWVVWPLSPGHSHRVCRWLRWDVWLTWGRVDGSRSRWGNTELSSGQSPGRKHWAGGMCTVGKAISRRGWVGDRGRR